MFCLPAIPPIVQTLLVLLAPFALLLLETKKPGKIPVLLGIKNEDLLGQLLEGVKLFLLVFVVLLTQAILFGLLGAADAEKVVALLQKQSLITLFAILFIAPIGEELLFRGYLQKKIGSIAGGNEKAGIFFASVLFAALHAGFGSLSELAGAFTAAIIFGFYVSRNKRIIPAIIAHALTNFYAVGVSFIAK